MEFLLAVLALAALVMGAVAILQGMKEFINKYISKKDEEIEVAKQSMQTSGAIMDIQAMKGYLELNKVAVVKDHYNITGLAETRIPNDTSYTFESMIRALKEEGYIIVGTTDFCNLQKDGNHYCSSTMKLQLPTGEIRYLTFVTGFFTDEWFVLPEGEEKIEGVRDLVFYHPAGTTVYDFEDFFSKLVPIERKEIKLGIPERKVRFFAPVNTPIGVKMVPTLFNLNPLKEQDLGYSVKLFLTENSTRIESSLEDALDFVEEVSQMGTNIAISGPVGVGKTTFSYLLASKTDCIVTVEYQQLKEYVENAGELHHFTETIRELKNEYDSVVIVFDEADKVFGNEGNISAVNALLDGATRQKFGEGVTMILIFNTPPEQLPPSIKRPGRIGLFLSLHKINKDKAKKLLEANESEEKTFAKSEFEQDKRSNLSLAETLSYLRPMELQNKLQNLLQKKYNKKPKQISVTKIPKKIG